MFKKSSNPTKLSEKESKVELGKIVVVFMQRKISSANLLLNREIICMYCQLNVEISFTFLSILTKICKRFK